MVFNALIPARSLSKRVPDKNIRDFCGKPLMVWTIEAALNSGCFQDVYVSTDSKKYMEIADRAGSNIIDRGDLEKEGEMPMGDVIDNAIPKMTESHGLVLLQPTSPLRCACDIVKAVDLYLKNAQTDPLVVSGYNVDKIVYHDDYGQKKIIKNIFVENGAIYVSQIIRSPFLNAFKRVVRYSMPKFRSVEIDTEDDWEMCKRMVQCPCKETCDYYRKASLFDVKDFE